MKILVAGAGIAGSCMTTVLREAGHEVVLVDRASWSAASRCAFAVTRTAWWGGEERHAVRRSLDWYNLREHIVTKSAVIHDVRRARTLIRPDYYLVNPVTTLVHPDLEQGLDWWVHDADRSRVLAGFLPCTQEDAFDALVICAAGETPRLAGQEPHGRTVFGGMFTAEGNRLTRGGQLSVLRRTDRLSYTAAFVGGKTRIGASRCSTPGEARRIAEGIRDRLLSEGVVSGGVPDWWYRAGKRFITDQPIAQRINQRVWTLAGLGRTGFATAPAAALDIATEILSELR